MGQDQIDKGRLLLNTVAQVLLSSEKPKLSDNFFDIGGDSLNMVQVCLEFQSKIPQNSHPDSLNFRSFHEFLTLVIISTSRIFH